MTFQSFTLPIHCHHTTDLKLISLFLLMSISRFGFGNVSLVLGLHCKNNSEGVNPDIVFGVFLYEKIKLIKIKK